MFNLLKQIKCSHDWHFVQKYSKSYETSSSYRTSCNEYEKVDLVEIYCPKCKELETVSEIEWNRIQKINEIEEKFQKAVDDYIEACKEVGRR